MGLIVLDTSVIIDVVRGSPAAVEAMQAVVQSGGQVAVPATVIQELYVGIGRLGRIEERRRIERMLAGCHQLSLTPDIAQRAGLLEARLHAAGRPHTRMDVQIAATAVAHAAALMSRDQRIDIDGLDVITY